MIEIITVFNQYEFVKTRSESIYLNILVWKANEFDPQFVVELSQNALNDKKVKHKQPWITLLEDNESLGSIVYFFKNNIQYGDKYFQEKMLYIVSNTNISIEPYIHDFLNHQETIVVLATLSIIRSQALLQYLIPIQHLFSESEDTDILLDSAALIALWSPQSDIISKKIERLREDNEVYFSECIDELKSLNVN